jgi:hypothetical protein
MPHSQRSKELRRSTRVPLEISVEVDGEPGRISGSTVMVNFQGALIRTEKPLQSGSRIVVTVYLTSKTAVAKVVHVAAQVPTECGIELERPQNIWGVSLPPNDWEEDGG